MSKWIDIELSKPPKGKYVLCINEPDEFSSDIHIGGWNENNGKEYWHDDNIDDGCYLENVTYWQYLPEMPLAIKVKHLNPDIWIEAK